MEISLNLRKDELVYILNELLPFIQDKIDKRTIEINSLQNNINELNQTVLRTRNETLINLNSHSNSFKYSVIERCQKENKEDLKRMDGFIDMLNNLTNEE